MVIDSIDVRRGVEKGLFEPLPEDKLPFADMFPEVTMDGSTKIDGKRYGITEKFGYNTIGFNKEKVDAADMQSMPSLVDPKYKGRIAIYDYYLPVIGMAALSLGKKTADLTEADLPAIRDVLLKMKANSKLVGEVTASQTALATGEVDILVGGGEWVTAGLAKENPALDFSIPKEGAVLWSQSLAMFTDSKNKDLALKFIQYVLSPEGQARLATSACYWGMPANTQGGADRRSEEDPALRRAAGLPGPRPALPGPGRGARQEDAGRLDRDAASPIDRRHAMKRRRPNAPWPGGSSRRRWLWTLVFFVLPFAPWRSSA